MLVKNTLIVQMSRSNSYKKVSISFAELEDSRNGIVSNRVKYFQYVLANRIYFESNKFKNEFNI